MKVLAGPPVPKPHQFTCSCCTAELEATIDDVVRWQDDQRDGSCAVLICVVCGKEEWIDQSLLPHWRIAAALKERNER